MSLTSCIKKAGPALNADDKSAVMTGARKYRADGMSADDAGRAAIRDQIAAVKAMLKSAMAAASDAKPAKARKLQAVRGSMALASISARLGGISKKLLPDLSQKVLRRRTDKKTGKVTPYITWDNPPHSMFGPLFRDGGTEDMGEIARVLSEEGFIEPGLYESDPLAAAQASERIVKAELAKGGATLRIGDTDSVDAEMQAARDAAMDDGPPDNIFDDLDDGDLEASGYVDASQDVKDATETLLAEAEQAGIDTEALREDAARSTEGKTEDEYHAELQAATGRALQAVRQGGQEDGGADTSAARGSDPDRREAAGSEGAQPGEVEGLTSPTADSLAAADQRARDAQAADAREQKRLADKARADADLGEFTLTGSDRPADVAAAAGQGSIFDAPSEKPAADKGASNTVFTADAAEKARAILRKKLGQMNSGFDPEILAAGITLAGYHVEAGARSFAAYSKAMIDDMGESIRPFLKSWYVAIRFDPRATAFRDGMTPIDQIKDEADMPSAAPAEPAEPAVDVAPSAAPTLITHTTGKGNVLSGIVRTDLTQTEAKAIDPYTFKKDGGWFIREKHLQEPAAPAPAAAAQSLTEVFVDEIRANRMPKDNIALRKMVEQFDGAPASAGRMKQAQEALEAAIVDTARWLVSKKEGPRSTFSTLVRLYESQPLLNSRTSTSIANQAYSTPAPLAFVASELAGINRKTIVLEPTAGNGMLLIAADPRNALANELNDDRAASLRAQGFEVTQDDAGQIQRNAPGSVDAVITNPPFGPIKNEKDESIKVKIDGYTLGQIDHLIAARALSAMKDDGQAVLIIGANKVTGEQSNNDLIFFNWLYGNYNVTSHFEVDGDLYLRQGAGWPVRVITINGRQKSETFAPQASTIGRASTWSEVYERFEQSLDAQRAASRPGDGAVGVRPGRADEPRPVPVPAGSQARRADSGGPESGTPGDGNVAGERPAPVVDRGVQPVDGLGQRTGAVGSNDQAPGPVEGGRVAAGTGAAKPARNPRAAGVAPTAQGNDYQTTYVARSSRKDNDVLIPVNMADPLQAALDRLEDEVGDIDQYVADELGYESVDAVHAAFMGLQVDSIASAVYQIKAGKGVIVADQTGIGKGRQAAGIIRWAEKQGKIPVFVSVKPSLFTDMYGDLHDIGTDDIAPLIMNVDESIKGSEGEALFANKKAKHKRTIDDIAATGALPSGRNALFMTYSQINEPNRQRQAVLALAPNAVFILDESHNAGGDSQTGQFMRDVLGLASGVTYLSATYAKRPDNMPLYFKTDIGDAVASDAALMQAMADGGLPLQTVVSNNLVKAGQMFRRERSYDGVNIESRADTGRRADHVALSDETTLALRAIVEADRTFHETYVKSLQKELKEQGSRVLDIAGNQAQESVDHTQFTSIVHNFVRQMLLGLKAQESADEAIRSLKRGEKPLIAVENTMGSFLAEYAADNNIKPGAALTNYDYRTVLSRALDRTRFIVKQLPNGDKEKVYIPMSELNPDSLVAYRKAQAIIDKLDIDIPVSPIDWMRNEISKAGYSVAEITGRDFSVDYGDPKNPKLDQLDAREQKDKVRTTRMFNDGSLDAIILNVAGSTGISLHASEKFKDQRQRHMIVAQAAQDINIFMQMLGRIHRTGQVRLPKYTLLSADLPAEIRPTALLSGKMKSLNANTSSNTESATSVKSADMLNKYGDQIVAQYLEDNPELAKALDIQPTTELEDIARKATGRLALMPIKVQEQFYEEVQEQYQAHIDYLNKTNQNELEPRTFDFDARETKAATIFEGQNKASPFGEDATYGEYSVKAQGKAMTPAEIQALIAENLGGKTANEHMRALRDPLMAAFTKMRAGLTEAQQSLADESARKTGWFLDSHQIGSMFRLDINEETYNAVITNIRSTHKSAGNPFALSKVQVTVAVNGALRSVTVPATQFEKITVNTLSGYGSSIPQLFKEAPADERESVKIVTGNLLGAYGQLQGSRGTIISFTKSDGTIEQGILLPKKFNFANDVRQDYRLKKAEDVFAFLQGSTNPNIERFGVSTRDNIVRVLPNGSGIVIQVPKSKAKGGKYFLDKKLIAAAGEDFASQGNAMRLEVSGRAASVRALDVLMNKEALYAAPSMAAEAREMAGDPAPQAGQTPSLKEPDPSYTEADDDAAARSDRTDGTKIADAGAAARAGSALSSRARITGLGIPERVRTEGSTALVGTSVNGPEDLAALAQVYRDPRYETFRIFFVKGETIVHSTGVSSRLPGETAMVPSGMTLSEYLQVIRDQMTSSGADGYYLLHNHPSGDPTPSDADQSLTRTVAAQVAGFKSHVIINSNKFAVIDGKTSKVSTRDFGPDLLLQASKPSAFIGTALGDPADLVALGKSMQKPGWLTLIGSDSKNLVRVVAEAPASILQRDNIILAGTLRRLMRLSGSRSMSLVGSSADVASRPVQDALSRGLLRDAVGDVFSRTMAERGNGGKADGFTGAKGRTVAEGAPAYPAATRAATPLALPRGETAWRDSLGRFKVAPTAWAYSRIASFVSDRVLTPLKLNAMPPELRTQVRAMKLQIQQSKDVAVRVAGEGFKLSEDDRALVSDIIEGELAAGTVPPQHAMRMAAGINTIMDQQTNDLVALGMLSSESAERWRGAYLPRFYKSKMMQTLREGGADLWGAAVRKAMRKPAVMRGIKGDSLKGRGLWETVPAEELANWEALGWEVRDPEYQAGVSPDVQVWRDYSREEREAMGEIRDAGFRFTMGYLRTQRDIAMGRMFAGIAADRSLSAREGRQPADWVQVPDGSIPGTGGVKRYGRLSGMYVAPEVMNHLENHDQSVSEALQLWRKALGMWKEGKVVLNPVSHANNVMGNVSMAHFAGVSYWEANKYAGAINDLVRKSPMVDEARNAGLFLGTMSQEELLTMMPPELRAMAAIQASKTERSVDFVWNVLSLWLRKPAGRMYEAEDLFFRYLIYRDARGRGLPPPDAVDYSQRYVFTYDDLPKNAQVIRDFAIPFFAYTYKAIPALLHTAANYPHRFLAPAGVMWGLNAAMYAMAAGEDEESWAEQILAYINDPARREKAEAIESGERENLPPWMKGSSSVLATPKAVRLGVDDLTGMPLFWDIAQIMPGGNLFDVENNAGGMPWPQSMMPSHPMLTVTAAMFWNTDTFFGKDIVDSNDTSAEAAEKRAAWLWKQMTPAIALGNYHSERLANVVAQVTGEPVYWLPRDATGMGKDGLPVQPKIAAMQTVGIKVRPIDVDMSQDITSGQRAKMIREIDGEIRRLRRLSQRVAISDRNADAEIDLQQTKKDRLRDGLTVDGKAPK